VSGGRFKTQKQVWHDESVADRSRGTAGFRPFPEARWRVQKEGSIEKAQAWSGVCDAQTHRHSCREAASGGKNTGKMILLILKTRWDCRKLFGWAVFM